MFDLIEHIHYFRLPVYDKLDWRRRCSIEKELIRVIFCFYDVVSLPVSLKSTFSRLLHPYINVSGQLILLAEARQDNQECKRVLNIESYAGFLDSRILLLL